MKKHTSRTYTLTVHEIEYIVLEFLRGKDLPLGDNPDIGWDGHSIIIDGSDENILEIVST